MLTIIVGQIINLKQLFVIQKNKGTSIFSYLIFIKRIKEREDHTNVKNKKIRGGGVLFTSNKKQYPIIQRNKSHERGSAVE